MITVLMAVLEVASVQTILVPEGAELLTAREQFEHPCVWFLCDKSKPMERRLVAMVGVGDPAPSDGRYIGSCQLMGGVFHVFERDAK
jgi:hypothetical protein